jgi:hypothetical protein
LVVDGYTPLLLDRILVKNNTAANNGIYSVTQLGVATVTPWILTRTIDYDQPTDMNNTIVPVANHGTTNALTSWIMTSTVATVDTDAVNFAAFTPAGANIVSAVSPGVGLAHFAGSTQTVTSSAVNLAGADVTGLLGNANYYGVVGKSYVQTDETRSSTTPGALATPDSCTFVLATTTNVLMMWTASAYNTTASGVNIVTAVLDTVNKDNTQFNMPSTSSTINAETLNYLATGLTAGSHTLQVFFSTTAATAGHWLNRAMVCVATP